MSCRSAPSYCIQRSRTKLATAIGAMSTKRTTLRPYRHWRAATFLRWPRRLTSSPAYGVRHDTGHSPEYRSRVTPPAALAVPGRQRDTKR